MIIKQGRFWVIVVVLALLVLSAFVIFKTWFADWRLGLPASTDRATRVNTVVAVSAYLAALVGVVVALVAYWQSSGRASLNAEIKFPGRTPNDLVFDLLFVSGDQGWPSWVDESAPPFGKSSPDRRTMLAREQGGQLLGSVELRNESKYAARNPGLRIEFDGLLCQSLATGWQPAADWGNQKNGYKAIQWDGGTEKIVHGNWSRFLPILNFNEIIVSRVEPPPKLIVTVVADGCPLRRNELPVRFRQHVGPRSR